MIVLYSGQKVKVLQEDKTHYLIQFETGTKIATAKAGVKNINQFQIVNK